MSKEPLDRAMDAIRAQFEKMQWRPIETAPKDGTIILLGGGVWGDDLLEEAPRVMAARWYKGYHYRTPYELWNVCSAEDGHSIFPYADPTHWMPLPEPPKDAANV